MMDPSNLGSPTRLRMTTSMFNPEVDPDIFPPAVAEGDVRQPRNQSSRHLQPPVSSGSRNGNLKYMNWEFISAFFKILPVAIGSMANTERPFPPRNDRILRSGVSALEATSGEPTSKETGGSKEIYANKMFQDDEGKMSVASSYAASVVSIFSTESLASTATDVSKTSGYSAVQIATATKTLLSIFHEDEILLYFYKRALENPRIGPERLERNLRRLFQIYAEDLGSEAKDRLEYLASRLVTLKARWLAQSIVNKLQMGLASPTRGQSEHYDDSSDEDDEQEVNENAFEDLVVFREFLVSSEAFITLRARLRGFIVDKIMESNRFTIEQLFHAPSMKRASPKLPRTWTNWIEDAEHALDNFSRTSDMASFVETIALLAVGALYLIMDNSMVAMGHLEPPLRKNMVRLRWRCNCGDALYSDVVELRKGGVVELMDHMQRLSGVDVRVTRYSHNSSSQQYIRPHPLRWLRNAVTKLSNAFGQSPKATPCLPQHNTSRSATTCSTPTNSAQQQSLHLLACMHRNRVRKVLKQDRIENVTTDRTLLCFLRQQYKRHRGRFLHKIYLKSVTGIFFVKFRLPIGGSVDVRHHNPCCVANFAAIKSCECIPPPPKVEPSPTAEYRCIPGPPATYPPIPPEYLSSLFTCPSDVHADDTWILDQLPKRTCGKLQGEIGKPAEGWGIYYQEGWDRDMITLLIFLIFVLASLLFGILWSRFRFDVQGAFGVSAYMVAACTILVSLIANWIEKAE